MRICLLLLLLLASPLQAAQEIISVAASDDDARQRDGLGPFFVTETIFFVGDGGPSHIGMRFVVPNIASGDTIDAATLELIGTGVDATDDMDGDIHCEDIDDSPDFTDNATVDGRTVTTANTVWTASNLGTGAETSPDFASAVQEVVDRAGWAAGNGLTVIIRANGTGTQYNFAAWDHATLAPAEITIDYTPGAGGGTALPLLNHYYIGN